MYNNAIYNTYRPYLPQIKQRKITEKSQEELSENAKGKNKLIQEYSSQNKEEQLKKTQYQIPYYNNQYNQYNQNNNQKRKTPVVKNIPKMMNIQQILIDFKSTIGAIGASEEVENEVNRYLELIDEQTQSEKPNKKIVISNLKVCADLLDNYITTTLNKPSSVVNDWVDALLKQPIDFKADKTLTKGAFETITGEPPQTAKLAEKNLQKKVSEQENLQTTQQKNLQSEVIEKELETIEDTDNNAIEIGNAVENKTEQDTKRQEIQTMIEKADALLWQNPDKALSAYSQAFEAASDENDKILMAEIYSKIGIAQNSVNNLGSALDCLNASNVLAFENGQQELLAQNHEQMGKIYDETGLFEPAFNHYHRSVAINGELENLDMQTTTLTYVGDMFSERYLSDEALGYYDLALDMAKENKNYKNASTIFSHCAKTNENTGDNQRALNNLKSAATISNKINDDKALANIYEQAGDLMKKMGFSKKSSDLYKKSYRLAQKLDDNILQKSIINKLSV